MKKFAVLALMLVVSACAHGPIYGDEDCSYKTSRTYKQYRAQEPKPVQPAPVVYNNYPCAEPVRVVQRPVVVEPQPCNGCQPTVKETREPVEIVYKKVTYTTVYEPKTTKNVSYEREPVKNAVVQVQKKPVVKEIIVKETPTVSQVIETQTTQEPLKISIEEVK